MWVNAYAFDSFIYKNNDEGCLNIGKKVTTINDKLFHHYLLNELNYQSFKFVSHLLIRDNEGLILLVMYIKGNLSMFESIILRIGYFY